VERGLYRLHQFYVAHDRLQVNASIQQRDYDAKTTLKIDLQGRGRPTDPGPRARRIDFIVQIARPSATVSRWGYRRPALARSASLLEGYFERQGYFRASVIAAARPDRSAAANEILFRVVPEHRVSSPGMG